MGGYRVEPPTSYSKTTKTITTSRANTRGRYTVTRITTNYLSTTAAGLNFF
jgi:hypothetical protein